MTSVVGFDVGNLASKIGLARNRGIDIIANEVSNRATPSLVAFGPRNRTLGEAAKTQETSNFKNTVGSLKRLIGRTSNDPDVTEIESKFLNAQLVDTNGTVGVQASLPFSAQLNPEPPFSSPPRKKRNLGAVAQKQTTNEIGAQVSYQGESHTMSATQLYAAYLGRLRDIAAAELKNTVNDCVISVPGWYTDIQRRAVLDAAEIANLHCLRLINETTATALGYGITKTDLPPPEEPPRTVAFVDIGHSQYQVSIVAFHKGSLTVKAYAYDHHFGGRDLDFALVQHFAEEFKGKYKIDVLSNKKAIFRLSAAVEKLKKVLSANAQSPLNVESIMNDIDASSAMSREEFEALIAPLLERATAPLERALAQAGITKEQIDAVEVVGGSSRVPALKSRIQAFFDKPLSFTCNQDEAIARGATLACATLSPIFKVRDFSITDIAMFPIDVEWEKCPEDTDTSLNVYAADQKVPSTKLLSFHRSAPFELVAKYGSDAKLPGGVKPVVGRYVVQQVKPREDGQSSHIKVKARLTSNGTFEFAGALLVEETEVPVDAAPVEGDAMETDGAAPGEEKKKKFKTTKKDIPARYLSNSLEKIKVDEFLAKEGDMYAGDKLVAETEDRKNALEEYVYDTRDKLDGAFAPYVTASVKESFKVQLQEAEDWLYTEEGEDSPKSAYVARLDALLVTGGPIKFRQREQQDRPAAERQLRSTIADLMQKATGGEERYNHLTEADLQPVIEKVAAAEKWIGDMGARQAERRKNEDPAMTSQDILKKRDGLLYDCTPVFNKPKPKVIPEKKADEQPKTTEPTPTPDADMKDGEAPEADAGAKEGDEEMLD